MKKCKICETEFSKERVIFKKVLKIVNEDSVISFVRDWGDNSLTINIDGSHTHCGDPKSSFENLIDDIYNVLIEKRGLTWSKQNEAKDN